MKDQEKIKIVKDDGTTKWYDMYWMGTFKSEEELAEFIKEYN